MAPGGRPPSSNFFALYISRATLLKGDLELGRQNPTKNFGTPRKNPEQLKILGD